MKTKQSSFVNRPIYIHTYIHTLFVNDVGQYKKAAKKLMWTYKFKYIYNNSNNNVNKLVSVSKSWH